MRLIDADALISKLEHILNNYTSSRVRRLVVGAIISMLKEEYQTPTIDAEPVIHAHWIENRDQSELQLICNQCSYDYIEADPDCKERHNFCPHCGAKMDEEIK